MRIRWRGLELPSRVICNRETLTDTFGEFHVEPFERGFGHTVGNSLRRILLSSLEGTRSRRSRFTAFTMNSHRFRAWLMTSLIWS